jgi:endogenous inhibitor of DNA gyrase (YacG/DUF329 family)
VPGQKGKVKSSEERCRYCRRPLSADDPQHKRLWPFCSERCKMAELGLWFQDRYVISRPLGQVADDAGVKMPPPRKGGKGAKDE